jgi:hypothetical protein
MATYRVMTWHGIPSQVQASDGTGPPVSRQLPADFQQEIDRTAMSLGLVDSDEYLEGWTWSSPLDRDGSAVAVAEAVAAELIEEWRRDHPGRGAIEPASDPMDDG